MIRMVWIFLLKGSLVFGEIVADQAVLRADEGRGPQGAFSMIVKVRDAQDGDVKDSVYKVYSKDKRYSLIEQIEPVRQAGRKLLMNEEELWLFSPNVSRPTRISFEQRLTGEVANGDLARTNFAEDYTATFGEEKIVEGKPCYALTLLARKKTVTYRKIMYWVEKRTFLPVKATFYALSGKVLKTAQYGGYKKILGKMRMTTVVITDALQKNRTSSITYSKHKVEKLTDSFFSKEALAN